jgi:hypothetical protein
LYIEDLDLAIEVNGPRHTLNFSNEEKANLATLIQAKHSHGKFLNIPYKWTD